MYLDSTRKKNLLFTFIAIVAGLFVWLLFRRGESTSHEKVESSTVTVSITLEAINGDTTLIAKLCLLGTLYLVCLADSDDAENAIRESLKDVVDVYIPEHRVLFCSTVTGRGSIIRQLQNTVHIDHDPATVAALEGKVPHIALPVEDIEEQVKSIISLDKKK